MDLNGLREALGGSPDVAAIVAAIEACTGAKCEVNVGKPAPIMLETILEAIGLDAKDCVMTGDRLRNPFKTITSGN